MSEPKRLVLVDDDRELAATLESIFVAPEFAVHAFADPREALLRLHDIGPDLILCSLDLPLMPGRSFMRMVKHSEKLAGVPFVFICADHTRDDMIDCLEDGADDFLGKPVDTPLLAARLRALLRMAHRLVAPDERADAVTGSVGSAGTLRLLRFCEDFRLTGRLTIDNGPVRHRAEFSGGELLRAEREPALPDTDPLDSLLAETEGSYRIEQARIDAGALGDGGAGDAPQAVARAAHEPPPAPAGEAARLPGGRLSMVESRSGNVQIQTEGENRPNFTVTTVLVRDGRVLRRIETTWQHPLQRRGDEGLAKQQIDEQHERIVASLRELALEGAPRRDTGEIEERSADGALLAWTIVRVAARAFDRLGSVATAALLRRTQKRALEAHPGLAAFAIDESGGVRFEGRGGPRVGHATMLGLIAWLADFLSEVAELNREAAEIDLRQATRSAAEGLERFGFYAAWDAAPREGVARSRAAQT